MPKVRPVVAVVAPVLLLGAFASGGAAQSEAARHAVIPQPVDWVAFEAEVEYLTVPGKPAVPGRLYRARDGNMKKLLEEFERRAAAPGPDAWPARVRRALHALVWQGDIIRHRRWTSLAHFVIAWGFLYYVLLNLVDLIDLYAPGWQPLGAGALAGVYRLLADLLSVGTLAAMLYFLVRRFVARAPALRVRANVRLHPAAASGIARDSLIVGAFIYITSPLLLPVLMGGIFAVLLFPLLDRKSVV